MARFQTKYDMKQRTVEHCEGPYLVSLEGFFDFNEAIKKLMIVGGAYVPVPSQFEPGSDVDDDDFDSPESSFYDVCDAIIAGRNVQERLSEPSEPREEVSKARKPKSDDESLPDDSKEPSEPVGE